MTTKFDKYVEDKRLVETTDPEIDKAIYRGPGFEGPELGELDRRISEALRQARDATGLTRAEVAPFLGLHEQVYGRYERNETKMHVTRLIHLSEVLDFSPIDFIMAAAPYRFGKTPSEADKRRKLIKVIESLPADAVESLLALVEAMTKLRPREE
ncbi:Helix-turn-helix [Rhizobium tibeticum]|uniref:Helix-turn-helix n=1 Tax=Rhizobium tibeticum TaxID=501024 RepID=A0A1H8V5A9_9HYPH|nr:helix-turn-helix transcriptional regulator [Rhizobium tibeticum]SEI18401.1 Helix-turn-helix [Rhizobium tibeticum]SEP10606.1 Helix-turn-helix [Rhizobium tibeticum]